VIKVAVRQKNTGTPGTLRDKGGLNGPQTHTGIDHHGLLALNDEIAVRGKGIGADRTDFHARTPPGNQFLYILPHFPPFVYKKLKESQENNKKGPPSAPFRA
jgi:hypothetical protein